MNKYLALTGILFLTALVGCAPTTGTNREYDIPITVSSNTGEVNILLELKVDAASTAEQTSSPVISPTTRLQLTEGGSTSAGEASTLKEVASTLKNKIMPSTATTTTTATTTPVEQVVPVVEQGTVEEVENVQDVATPAEGAVKEGE